MVVLLTHVLGLSHLIKEDIRANLSRKVFIITNWVNQKCVERPDEQAQATPCFSPSNTLAFSIISKAIALANAIWQIRKLCASDSAAWTPLQRCEPLWMYVAPPLSLYQEPLYRNALDSQSLNGTCSKKCQGNVV